MQDPKDSAAAKLASERLEQTRRALWRHMSQHGDSRAHHQDTSTEDAHQTGRGDEPPPDMDDAAGSTWQHLRQTASAWWHSHPAHLALEVAEPVFAKYAQAHPLRVLALSAAVGAGLVLVRPWRLISVTGLLVAAVKSTQMSALASAMLRPTSSEALRRHEAEHARHAERERWRQAQAAARAHDRGD